MHLSEYRFRVIAFFLCCLLPAVAPAQTRTGESQGDFRPTVILISIDGARWDYLDAFSPPTLLRLASGGVRSKGLIPVFPTKTFPNHYSMVTGLYAEEHGIVANSMFDPEFNAVFGMGRREEVRNPRWWEGEPIWVTAERQGQLTAPLFWVGSEAAIAGIRPTYWMPFDDRLPHEARVQQLLTWLDAPVEKRPRFLTLYFSDVDHAGHEFGPDAPQTRAAMLRVDSTLASLVLRLEERGLLDLVNLIVVSDHGMAATHGDRVILLDEFIDSTMARVSDWSPVLGLWPKEGMEEIVYAKLRSAHPRLTIYRKRQIPERLHYRAHRRIPPIVGIADEGWTITHRGGFGTYVPRARGGDHGYDNGLPSMWGIFVARGPAFRVGAVIEPFSLVHLHSLISHLLELTPARTSGSLDSVRVLLR